MSSTAKPPHYRIDCPQTGLGDTRTAEERRATCPDCEPAPAGEYANADIYFKFGFLAQVARNTVENLHQQKLTKAGIERARQDLLETLERLGEVRA